MARQRRQHRPRRTVERRATKKAGRPPKKRPQQSHKRPTKKISHGGPPPRAATLAPPPSTCRACQGAHSAHTCGKTRKRRKVAQPPLEPPRVVVIGAGAGIGCARTLEQLGAVVTVVSEAQSRRKVRVHEDQRRGRGRRPRRQLDPRHQKKPTYTAACQLGLHCVDTGDDVALRDGESGVAIERDSAEDKRAFEAFNSALASARKNGEEKALAESRQEGHVKARAMPRHGVDQALGPAVSITRRAVSIYRYVEASAAGTARTWSTPTPAPWIRCRQ